MLHMHVWFHDGSMTGGVSAHNPIVNACTSIHNAAQRTSHLLLITSPARETVVQDDAYSFDIGTDPRQPAFLNSTQLLLTAVTDHVFGLKNGNFLLTQVCEANVHLPWFCHLDSQLKSTHTA
jgi:hypothetical protein